jgi:Spy/CpxP family protein refolding chaperone
MKSSRVLVLSAIASLGLAAGAIALAADATGSTPQHHAHGFKHSGPMKSPFMRAVHQLNLSSDQQERIHSMLSTQRQQAKVTMSAQRANAQVLANPGDPGYVAAVAAEKSAAAAAIQARSDLEVQIYGILSSDQQAQLPKVLADMKARADQRRAQWQQNTQQNVKTG